MRAQRGPKAVMQAFRAQNHPLGQRRSAHSVTPGLCVQRDWLASGDRDPPRRGWRAQTSHPVNLDLPVRVPARHPSGQDLPMRFATVQLRCSIYTPREPIEDAPALTLFSGRLGYGLHGRRNRRRTDAP